MQFDGVEPGEQLFGRRWLYCESDTPWTDVSNGKSPLGKPSAGNRGNLPGYSATEYSWDGVAIDGIVTTAITLDASTGDHIYTFYDDQEKLGESLIPADCIIPATDTSKFRLMGQIAGTVYSVRVYDRVLSEAERAQNHFADLVYYYGLDISAIEAALETMTDLSPITSAFADMSFNMTK